jgi:hypothetical protein
VRKHLKVSVLGGALLFLGAGMTAQADSFNFNFNSLAAGANNAAIQTYMNAQLAAQGCIGCTVTVTGAVADKTYNGEGHVVGNGAKSLTLGTSDGATNNSTLSPSTTYDTFIANTTDSAGFVSSEIDMKFNFAINGTVSFDYEIFPDGSANQPPDFIFNAKNASNVVVSTFTTFGSLPSSLGNGTATHSPNSGAGGTERSAQFIGTKSVSLSNAWELDFVDWPATIAIDDLVISRVPEPGSIMLLGTGLLGLAALARKSLKA